MWMHILEQDASNSDFDGHDDLKQLPHRLCRSPKNASITVGKTIEIALHGFVRVKLEIHGVSF